MAEFLSQDEIDKLLDYAEDAFKDEDTSNLNKAIKKLDSSILNKDNKIIILMRLSKVVKELQEVLKEYDFDFLHALSFYKNNGYLIQYLEELEADLEDTSKEGEFYVKEINDFN